MRPFFMCPCTSRNSMVAVTRDNKTCAVYIQFDCFLREGERNGGNRSGWHIFESVKEGFILCEHVQGRFMGRCHQNAIRLPLLSVAKTQGIAVPFPYHFI